MTRSARLFNGATVHTLRILWGICHTRGLVVATKWGNAHDISMPKPPAKDSSCCAKSSLLCPESVLEIGEVPIAAGKLGLEAITFETRQREDIALAFDALKDRAEALYIANSAFMAANRVRLTTLALGLRLATICASRAWPEAGALMSFGVNFSDMFRRSAEIVDARAAEMGLRHKGRYKRRRYSAIPRLSK